MGEQLLHERVIVYLIDNYLTIKPLQLCELHVNNLQFESDPAAAILPIIMDMEDINVVDEVSLYRRVLCESADILLAGVRR